MLFVGGIFGPFFEAMAVVVAACLIFSLIESKLILPAHLAQARIPAIDEDDLFNPQRNIGFLEKFPRFFLKIQRHVQHGLHHFIQNVYKPWLEQAIDARGVTLSIFVAVLIFTVVGLIGSGVARFNIIPQFGSDFIQVNFEMQAGSSPQARNAAATRIENAILDMKDEYAQENPDSAPLFDYIGVFTNGETGAQMWVELPKTGAPYLHSDLADMWRERVGEIAGVKELKFSGVGNFVGDADVSFRFNGSNYEFLEGAAAQLSEALAKYEGVFDVRDSSQAGGNEIKLTIKPEAEALGLTMTSLGRQVRQAFYGEEAQRIQRGKDEIKVMVRYPLEQRRSVANLENMRIRTPSGEEVPFESVAEVSFGQAYSRISRLNRERSISVSANIDPGDRRGAGDHCDTRGRRHTADIVALSRRLL